MLINHSETEHLRLSKHVFIVIVGKHHVFFDFERTVIIFLQNCVDVIFLMNHFNSLKEDDFQKTI